MIKSHRPGCCGGTHPGDPNDPPPKDRFEDQSLEEQAAEILKYLDSGYPPQTVVPGGRVELLRRTLKRLKSQKQGEKS